jgi:PAS domain S-box-containing protein
MKTKPTPGISQPPDLRGLCEAITEHAPLPMATVEGAGHIVRYANPAFCRLLRKPMNQLVGKPMEKLLPKKDACVTLIGRVLRTGKPENYTEKNPAKPHPVFWSYTIWPVMEEVGLVGVMIQVIESAQAHETTVAMNEALVLGSLRQHELTEAAENLNAQLQLEIAERKQAEARLRRKDALFTALVEQAPVGVYVVDAQFRLQQANPTALSVFKNVQPLIGREFSEIARTLWPQQVADRVVRRFRHTLKTGESYQSPEFTERRRDTGVEEVYEWQIQRVTLPVGEYGVVCFFNNITERKRLEAVQHRVSLLAAKNERANLEIARRRILEKSLRESELAQGELLEESRGLQVQLRQLTRQIITVQEDERKAISRALHDEVMQTLVSINLELSALSKAVVRQDPTLKTKIANAQRLVENSVIAVHQFARDLRPTVLDDFGLIPALHAYTQDLATRKKIAIKLTIFAGVEALESAKRTVLFRVAQEALTNVTRHAQATQIKIGITDISGIVRMEINDNGKSFHVEKILLAKNPQRLGLIGMKERLEMVGGSLSIKSAAGKGTTVRAEMPFTTAEPPPRRGKLSVRVRLRRSITRIVH